MQHWLNSCSTAKSLRSLRFIIKKRAMIRSLLSLILFLCVHLGFSEKTHEPALLVVSYDGFRPDYLNRKVTPNLNKFRTEGTSAQYMNPVFPTKTFVNHFSIATVSFILFQEYSFFVDRKCVSN